jgi:hypothetical protein
MRTHPKVIVSVLSTLVLSVSAAALGAGTAGASPAASLGRVNVVSTPGLFELSGNAFTGTVRITSAPAGIDCQISSTFTAPKLPSGPCSGTFRAGQTVTLSVSPDYGSRFDGWGLSSSRPVAGSPCTGTASCVITVKANGYAQVDAETSPLAERVQIINTDLAHGEVLSTPLSNTNKLTCGLGVIQHRPDICVTDYPFGMPITLLAGHTLPIRSAQLPCDTGSLASGSCGIVVDGQLLIPVVWGY